MLCTSRQVRSHSVYSMLPFSLGGALLSVATGQVISRTGRWRPVMWLSWAIMVLGWGLMTMLDDTSNKYVHTMMRMWMTANYDSAAR